MESNEQKCKYRNSITNDKTKTFLTDSDVFYDVPDENDSAIPTTSNRSRTTQNDRNRDHTNLSHKPNIEAPAGPRQQPAGQRQTHQAKDKNDEYDNGDNTNKERSSLENYLNPREACLCSNVSQDGYRNLSSEAGSSIVKLSFSTNSCADLQGSYKCFCGEEEGSSHKFWCQRYEVLENEKKTIEDSMRAFVSEKKLIERKEDPETTIAQKACCSQKTILDFKTKPAYECLCVRKSLIVSSCKNQEIESQELNVSSKTGAIQLEREENTGPSSTEQNITQKTSFAEPISQLMSEMIQISKESSKNPYTNSESLISIATEDLRPCEDFQNSIKSNNESSGRLHLKESKTHQGKHSRLPNWNDSCCSVGTAITPRQTVDENVIPLLKGIFDVLQAMREEKLHLGPIASNNIDIYLDEPFNGLPRPPPAPPSSPKFPKELLEISCDDPQSCIFKPSRNNLIFKEETHRGFINSEDNLSILEPPERDVDDIEINSQETGTTSQRLIPVDMDLIRTDEELIWEPDSNFDKPEEETKAEKILFSLELEESMPMKAQLKQFAAQSNEQLKIRSGGSFPRERLQDLYNSEENESISGLSSLKRSSSMEAESCEFICGEPENCHEDCSSNIESHSDDQTTTVLKKSTQELRLYQEENKNNLNPLKIRVSQATQVNSESLHYLNPGSAQFSTLNSQIEGLSEEKLLKIPEINKSKEAHLTTINYQNKISKFDVGTESGFDNADDRRSIKPCHYSQEPTNPQNQEMSQFIESILFDLKAMDSFRKNNTHWQSFARLPCPLNGGWRRPSKDLSYPVTIETVQELGANSLFVKWRVQNIGNIGGYEIFLDGRLTNRYFNCIHRAAVICDVNLQCPHRIILRAQPLLPPSSSLQATHSFSSSNAKCPSITTTHPEASCPQPDGSVWYPSVYHFEPNSLSAPISAVLY